jgi:hypothetical protein
MPNGTVLCHKNTGLKPGQTETIDGVSWAFTGVTDDGRCGVFKVHEPLQQPRLRVVGGRSASKLTAAAALPSPEDFFLARFTDEAKAVAGRKEGEFWFYDDQHRQQRQGTGKDKKFAVHHQNTDGEWVPGAGKDLCLCWNERCLTAADGIPLYAEGEKSAAAACDAGLLGVSIPGHEAASLEKCTAALARHKGLGMKLVAYVADNDHAGKKKAAVIASAASAAGLPFVGINAGDVWPNLPKGGSIDDLTLSGDEIIATLEQAFREKLARNATADEKTAVIPKEDLSFEERWALLEAAADELVASDGSTIKQRSALANTATELKINRLTQPDLDQLLMSAHRRSRPLSKPLTGGTTFKTKRNPFVVDGIYRHGLNLLVSAPGVGKSRKCAHLAASWLRGDTTFLERKMTGPPVEDRYVLIIGTDQDQDDWAVTLAPAGLCVSTDPFGDDTDDEMQLDPRLTLHALETDTKLDADGLRIIRRWCDEHPNCLVIIDSLAAVLPPGIDEEKSAAAQPIYALHEALGTCWCILTHHTRKAAGKEGSIGVGASRGSGAIDGAVSRLITLSKIHRIEHGQRVAVESDPRRELLSTKRGGADVHLILDSTSWTLKGTAEELKAEERRQRAEENLTEDQAECLGVLESDAQKWFTTREIVEALGVDWLEDKSTGGKVRNSTSKRMIRLEQLGLVEKASSGTDKSFRIRP